MGSLFQISSNSLKIFLISTTLLSAAVLLKLSAPAVTDFAVTDVPSIWNRVVSWLKPPYLYLVINCIIITIVASSKLQNKFEDHSSHAPTAVVPVLEKVADFYSPVVLKNHAAKAVVYNEYPAVYDDAKVEKVVQVNNPYGHVDAVRLPEKDMATSLFNVNAFRTYPEVNEVVRKPSPAPVMRQDSLDYNNNNLVSGYSAEKPPASARFSHRKNVKSTPEGGKASLRVTKPKRQDTLESTWKTITEGRAMPLTRHLRKSDTWETHGGRTPPQPKMNKSETFHDRTNTVNSPLTPSPGSGKLKKEPSLSQDELNKRVEAFINKFNEEMRLQRQQSLQQYMDMINRGAH